MPCCGLIPGGVRKEISAAAATRVLERAEPSGPVQHARHELAAVSPSVSSAAVARAGHVTGLPVIVVGRRCDR